VLVDASRNAWSALESEAAALEAAAATTRAPSAAPPSALARSVERRSTFPEFLAALQLFLALHAASNRKNGLAVIGFDGSRGGFV
jgi:hypothetical protein